MKPPLALCTKQERLSLKFGIWNNELMVHQVMLVLMDDGPLSYLMHELTLWITHI